MSTFSREPSERLAAEKTGESEFVDVLRQRQIEAIIRIGSAPIDHRDFKILAFRSASQ